MRIEVCFIGGHTRLTDDDVRSTASGGRVVRFQVYFEQCAPTG
jgi:hypothetical protein